MRESPSAPVPDAGLRSGPEFFDSFFDGPESASYGWGPSQDFQAASVLFRQGAAPKAVYYVERGLVKLTCGTAEGLQLIVGLRRRRWLLGAAAALLDRPHAATATALTECSLRSISASGFLRLVKAGQSFSFGLGQMLSEEVYKQVAGAVALGCMSARDRLEHLLRELVLEQAPLRPRGQLKIRLPLKYAELAELVAVRPEYLSYLLRRMESEGLVRREKGSLAVLKKAHFLRSPLVCGKEA